jgi:hypothetical protein
MTSELMDMHGTDDGEPSNAQERIPTEQAAPDSLLSSPMYSEMSVPVLAAQCMREIENSRRGEPCTETYAVELFRRATVQSSEEARIWVQYCFGEMVRDWLRRHPRGEEACRLESEEYHVAQAFERFWQATVSTQGLEFSRLAAALQYLRACLNGAILDRLRASARAGVVGLPEPAVPGEPHVEDSSEAWGLLETILPNVREQRFAYLLFHCGLVPWEIIHFYPQEFSGVNEVYRLRYTIMERVLRSTDQLR